MKPYKYILLDWDGNIAKTLDVWLEAIRLVLDKRGVKRTDHEIGTSFGALALQLEIWGISDVDEAITEAFMHATALMPAVELYPDALEVLEYLHDIGKKLALITTSGHIELDELVDKYDLWRLFSIVVTGDDVTHHKPHAEPIEAALELLGGNKDEAIMIGDSDKDLGSAKNADVGSILFFPAEHHRFYDIAKLRAQKPTYVVEDFREIMKIIV